MVNGEWEAIRMAIRQLPFTIHLHSHFHHVINGLVISSPNRRASSSLNGPCIFR